MILNSPTATERDRAVIDYLERVLAVDATAFGREMFETTSDLTRVPAEEIVGRDAKEYEVGGGQTIAIAQVETVGQDLGERRDELLEALEAVRERKEHLLVALMVTDIMAKATALYAAGDTGPLERAFGEPDGGGAIALPGVMSRKKQVAPEACRCAAVRGLSMDARPERDIDDRRGGTMSSNGDIDGQETLEWVEALDAVVAHDGHERAGQLLERVVQHARSAGAYDGSVAPSAYVNSIPVDRQDAYPGDLELEHRIRAIIRWNAMATVLRANAESSELGGHIASYQSAATLYEVGFHHFWHAASDDHGGDLIYMQGHSSPGIYARAYLEGRLSEEDLLGFRQEVSRDGLSSYPHPWLMPDFWQFPTVSMGLGPIMAIYQARFMKYLKGRGLQDTTGRKVWAFLGDGETDEPESLGAISLAGRERLDNLIFVVNCNLQRLDGPVRGNGKIIQELETVFRGAGWNVLKVIWGSKWDPLLAADGDGLLRRRMDEAVDGEYQAFKSRDGAFVREKFFGAYPELLERVSDMSDDEIWALNRGGHDPVKVHAAYAEAMRSDGPPDRDPRQDDQGLRDGGGRRGPEHHPPAEEDDRRVAADVPRPLRARADRRADRQEVLLPARPRTRRSSPTCASAGRRSAAGSPPGAPRRPTRCRCRRWRSSRPSSAVRASARSRRRWPSCACSTRSCATSSSAPTSSRSCPTSRARSAWRGCSASSGSSPRSASSTAPRTPSS